MEKRKYHYYVLVCTDYGPVFVTDIPNRNYAKWDKLEPPMEFTKTRAEDIAYGLNLNGYMALIVMYPWAERTHQLYYYENGQFEWKQRKINESENEGGKDEEPTRTSE